MGLTSTLFTGLSGLNTNQFRLDVLGDNIANVNTNGYKGARTLFQTQFARTLTAGARPTNNSGGTNPSQVGLGSVLGSVARQFESGAIETTASKSDLAVEGDGFFVLRTPDTDQVYTRDGAFTLSAENKLVSSDGFFVQGFTVDSDFNIVPGVLSDLTIPLGILSTARATTEVSLSGTLDGSLIPASFGTITTSNALFEGAGAATAATQLTALAASAGGAALFADGDTITIDGIEKGGRKLPAQTFTIDSTDATHDDLGDLVAFLEDITGINTDAAVPPTDATVPTVPGVVIDAATGAIVFNANTGIDNTITIGSGVFVSDGGVNAPFVFTAANGFSAADVQAQDSGSAFTSFTSYDSLGNKVQVEVTFIKEAQDSSGTTWRFYAESADDTDTDRVLGTGTVVFDTNGDVFSSSGTQLAINRAGVGVIDPLTIDLDLADINGQSSDSALVMTAQDGFPPGSLNDFFIGSDGIISGTFSNGLIRTLGQVSLATFANPPGLVAKANNIYLAGPNSGEAQVTSPQTLGAGSVLSGAIELSNVDLSRQFIDIITASTGFSAASRVITTADQLLDELLLVTR